MESFKFNVIIYEKLYRYRISRDIDFLASTMEGFAFLKQLVLEKGFEAIFLENDKTKQLMEEKK